MPFPTPHVRRFLPLMVLGVLHRPAPSFWLPLSGLAAVLFDLASLANRTQQFQKNAYHNDKHLISESASSPSSTASMTPGTFKSLRADRPQPCQRSIVAPSIMADDAAKTGAGKVTRGQHYLFRL